MRGFSRTMPPLPDRRSWPSDLIPIIFVLLVASVVFYFSPYMLAGMVAVIVITTTVGNIATNRRFARLAAGRQGESIGSFAESFDCRSVDPWVIRAVYEGLQFYCKYDNGVLPLRATDELREVLLVDDDDVDDLLCEVATRSEHSLEDCDANPFFGRVRTAGDLVCFVASQPLDWHCR